VTFHFRSSFTAICLIAAIFATPAKAVVILDSTWKSNGGSKGHEAAGFAAHFVLANQPQFASKVGLWDGDQYGGSGTWIGNDDEGHAYILTAAHNFGGGGGASSWTYFTSSGEEFDGLEVTLHPKYNEKDDGTEGYDMAIVKLDGTIDDAGDAPCIYIGGSEKGKVGTIVGFGSRGIGSTGQQDKFYEVDDPAAAARNVIDHVEGTDAGNILEVDFDKEDGSANAFEDGDFQACRQVRRHSWIWRQWRGILDQGRRSMVHRGCQ